MSISVVIPVFNGSRYLPAFLTSLENALPSGAEVVFVDDASTEPVLDHLIAFRRDSGTKVLRNEDNRGYSAAVNRGLAECGGDFIVQLNTDLILDPACITAMLELLEAQSDAGIVGSKLLFPTNGRVQHIGMGFGEYSRHHVFYMLPGDHPLCARTRPMQIVTGATVAMRRRVLDKIGPLDERYFNYNEDLDHCLRAVSHGYVNYTCAESLAFHWVSQSGPSRFARLTESDAVFWSTWCGRYRVDLHEFVDEALRFVVDRDPALASTEFEALDLCRSGDGNLLIRQARQYWPEALDTISNFRQFNNPGSAFWLPMILPHWYQHHPRPFIYFVDYHRQLAENRLWFENRLRLVREELIVDTTGCVLTASEMLALDGLS